MNRAANFRRTALVVLLALCLVVGMVPWSLYLLGLYGAGGTPRPPSTLAPPEVRLATWHRLRGNGVPSVTPLNPYTYWRVVFMDGPRPTGELVAWQVARSHVAQYRQQQGMLWWHLSGAALTIWLTRHWTVEQLLTTASELRAG